MFNELGNVDCRKECRECVYYFEKTDFCLNQMYNVKITDGKCADKKSKSEYPATTLISNEELEFSKELTEFRDEDITIAELFQELKELNKEIIDY